MRKLNIAAILLPIICPLGMNAQLYGFVNAIASLLLYKPDNRYVVEPFSGFQLRNPATLRLATIHL
jgi:hypothetical protein